ncbi:acyl-CoA oxidase [Vararia minispora EC-137]|uniref:Acyl-CoA oxidase n=1 Tax=Vararia minispora EC-137 TaxID=1314806 RepID=A0ACB8QV21_9AGAM|nr:acyl-CoA oxidase [Vararia minispora EC-137]
MLQLNLGLRAANLSAKDVLCYGPRFWEMHLDPIQPLDIATFTIIAAGINLTAGTLAQYLDERPDLEPLVKSLLRLDTVALVMARLVVDGQNRGPRWFIVPICDERKMHPGVISRRLPPRTGTSPLDFSLTSFDHVVLPRSALLGTSLDAPVNPREAWWREVGRIPHGSMAVAAPFVSGLKHSAYVAGKYSFHRTIVGKGTAPMPIINFPTQQWPIMYTLAAARVAEAWFRELTTIVAKPSIDHRTTICRQFQRCTEDVAERCGAQGTFESNSMARMVSDLKGVVIAEGDVLALCIRLFSELLQERYALPLPPSSDSLLAQHAQSLLNDNIQLVGSISGGHRSQEFQDLILPQAEGAIAAFGHAMALSAARSAHVPEDLLDIYMLGVVDLDPSWYLQHANFDKMLLLRRKASLMHRTLPRLNQYLDELEVADYVRAPIISDGSLKEHMAALPTYTTPHEEGKPLFVNSAEVDMHVAKL